ncbi:fimbrial protein [Providencia vermicola]|uniref:fimbrial protein n=1 Tax=Providencia vermicola TaxID=333965 RepID=UPI0034E46495
MKNKYLSILLLAVAFTSAKSWAFTCEAQGESIDYSGQRGVYVDLDPEIQPGKNLVVNLGNSIQCRNDSSTLYTDPVWIASGSAFVNELSGFNGYLTYYGKQYPFPLKSATEAVDHTWGTFRPWQTVLYISPISAAGGVFIEKGSQFAQLTLKKRDSLNGNIQTIIWNIYANNSVEIPTGGCDISSRDVNVDLPDYDANASQQVAVPLKVKCAQTQNLNFTLSGTTAGSDTVFQNVAANGAQGIGIQILRNNTPVVAGDKNALGYVSTTPVSLGLSAQYGLTSGQVTAGLVKSVIDVTFTYQ